MKKTNTLLIMADEHARDYVGCYGNQVIKTPNLDSLASRGTRFTNAYCNSPLCVPSRASLITGRHVHQINCWDNGHAYNGDVPGWNRHLVESDHHVACIGKMHFRRAGKQNGFSEEILPFHLRFGIGDLYGMMRENSPSYDDNYEFAQQAGPGETNFIEYDRRVTVEACRWLKEETQKHNDTPWVLTVSFISPHFPCIAPEEFYNLYTPEQMSIPRQYAPEERPTHPVVNALERIWNYDDYFDEESVRRARQGYYGLCSFLDDNIGKVLAALKVCGLEETTRIIYTSDHGELLGNHGMWSTSVMYEDSVGIPLLMAGPEIPEKQVVDTPVSLVDLYPTILQSAGEKIDRDTRDLPGYSLLEIANGAAPERAVLSEYHAGGSITGYFMIRKGKWKYVYYVGYPAQLFNLENDPHEANDLAGNKDFQPVLDRYEAMLREMVDPEEVNRSAFEDQKKTLQLYGGVDAVVKRGYFGEHSLERNLYEEETDEKYFKYINAP